MRFSKMHLADFWVRVVMVKQKALHRSSFRQADFVTTEDGIDRAYAVVKKTCLSIDEIDKAGADLIDKRFRTVPENNMIFGLQRRRAEIRANKVSQRLDLKLIKPKQVKVIPKGESSYSRSINSRW